MESFAGYRRAPSGLSRHLISGMVAGPVGMNDHVLQATVLAASAGAPRARPARPRGRAAAQAGCGPRQASRSGRLAAWGRHVLAGLAWSLRGGSQSRA